MVVLCVLFFVSQEPKTHLSMDTRRSKTSIEISNTEEDQSKKRRATLRAEESSCATEGVKRRKTEGTTHHYHHPQKKKASEMKYFVGAHVSIAGGFGNAVKRSVYIYYILYLNSFLHDVH